MSGGLKNLSDVTNLRVAFDVWPAHPSTFTTTDEVARAAIELTLGDLLHENAAPLHVMRVAPDGVSLWALDALVGLSLDDFVRAVAGAFDPAAFAVAVVQPMRAPGDLTLRGVHCRATLGDVLIDVTGQVQGAEGPAEGRSVPSWSIRRGKTLDDRTRWIGVPPTVEVRLPMLGAADA